MTLLVTVNIQSKLTKFVKIMSAQHEEDETIARATVESFILIHGPMKEIRTDTGTEYTKLCIWNTHKQTNHRVDHSVLYKQKYF